MKKVKNIDTLLERCGYIRCQIEITDFLIAKELEIYSKMKIERDKLNLEAALLKRQAILKVLAELQGELVAIRALCVHVSSLRSDDWSAIDA